MLQLLFFYRVVITNLSFLYHECDINVIILLCCNLSLMLFIFL